MPSRYFKIEGTVRFKKSCAGIVEKRMYKSLNQEQIRADAETQNMEETVHEFDEYLDQVAKEEIENAEAEINIDMVHEVKKVALAKLSK